jgi:hypothetical protein
MSKLDQPLKLKHGLAAVAAALVLGGAATAIPMATAQGGGGNLRYVREVRDVNANSQAGLVTQCPRGTVVVGGGVRGTAGFASAEGQMINTSQPFDGGDQNSREEDGWIGRMDNFANAGNDRMAVYAICKG